ncbi:MAG: hypothetical protein KAJ03_11410 [Gammaproteobacteria bacterium]|nr:hypothetical protein [Gammaproteobacteria bacterium]
MIKTKYIRTSNGSMMPVYPHPADKKDLSQDKKPVPDNLDEDKTLPPSNHKQ